MFEEKTEVADRSAESADDMTAAEMAPMPTMDKNQGVTYCRVRGRTKVFCPRAAGDGDPYSVRFQSVQHKHQVTPQYTGLLGIFSHFRNSKLSSHGGQHITDM